MDTWIGFVPNNVQLRVMQLTFETFQITGDWPILQFVRLSATKDGIANLDECLQLLPRSYLYPRDLPLNPGDEVRLTVPALANLDAARHELDLFLLVLQIFGSKLETFEPSPREVGFIEVFAADLRQRSTGTSDLQLQKVFSLLQAEPLGNSSGHGPEGPSDWRVSMLPEEAKRLGRVSSVDEYLLVRHLFPDELPPFEGTATKVRKAEMGKDPDMQRETYHGFRVDYEPDIDIMKSYRDCWFHVFEAPIDRQPTFRVRMRIHYEYSITVVPPDVHPVKACADLAAGLGLRWIHGLIDLDRFERGRISYEERTEKWESAFGDQELDDGRTRAELLQALQRMNRAQQGVAEVFELDVAGVADVLGVSVKRIQGVLSELLLEELVEPAYPTHDRSATEGACRITGRGLQELRQTQFQDEAARIIHVEDIDSFDLVRRVTPGDVAQMLPNGLLPIPEVDVKHYLCEIIGENHVQKDWGGERSDVFTTQVRLGGKRVPAAFLLKGPAVGPVMRPSHLGSSAYQE
jgi:hypothetical protein